jgi:two-component system response regulator
VVLTTSTNHRDISSSYLAGASSYVAKPVDVDGFLRTIAALKAWWFEEVILPAAE